ncbi:metal ABC transporter ATP-binding protein [Clostridium malenominatum]|uniref:Metal ABC transporter ATP-binding protein n=1 Tax=Clostridium malenominatum TaxID=1539 RepID=A0ABN1IND9_9CLOT
MIHIDNISFSYNGIKPYMLNNLNFKITEGSYTSIVGENGSYKSTLLKLILGLLKPNEGSIKVTSNNIGYVPQRGNYNSEFPITVYEIMKCHAANLKIKDKKIVYQCLEQLGITQLKNSLIGNLSGGQQQKVFIARALIGQPDLLILDEPSTGVDLKSQNEIYGFLKHINRVHSVTIISVEHNLKPVIENSTEILEMCKGDVTLHNVQDYLSKNHIILD